MTIDKRKDGQREKPCSIRAHRSCGLAGLAVINGGGAPLEISQGV